MERAPALAPSSRFAAVLQVAEDPLEPRRETPHQRGLQLQLLGREGARPGGLEWQLGRKQGGGL